ncbi:MAG: hypothetical protein A2X67_13930 [Ignavibacteria bacterium GWA2_55_11]|nr:MAG: hypothetical protein A2X67_13930 [Ignavibacteria bacterium GWA2_55_11]OGU43313.1 MAG: hypothetical protein A2X68_04555 [Ignavibacteria bacterium GWC2_56_12]OGU63152.1 MAG: hypothetical protein A3C56_06455 [Ignavibacteria bacterium RIFCSPHIGHO2_02_FULL_56_12]OGU70583.1 MAG: hypothetical protein A3G43_06700 [Ignavibacteria bacterium RIFCSPLOWO2_12_FULL_56_21]OGU73008.1 MAG: hypothetical protein A3H45_13075 [Ignavibacteria bacterium RIFCSPLOWO2_02_FULL_55_14]
MFSAAGDFMKKFVVLGVLSGLALSAIILYLRHQKLAGSEFKEFFDSSAIADELFGDAFQELPDKI